MVNSRVIHSNAPCKICRIRKMFGVTKTFQLYIVKTRSGCKYIHSKKDHLNINFHLGHKVLERV